MMIKKILALTFVAFMLISSLPFTALGEDDNMSVSIEYKDGNKSISDAVFNVYLVATPDKDGGYIPTESFASHPIDYSANTDEALYNLATTLEGYVFFSGEEPLYSGKTDENGIFRFESATRGMYLFIGEKQLVGDIYYTAESFIICLPAIDDNGEEFYDVTVNTKFTAVHEDAPPTSRKALKVWDDDSNAENRPNSITVYLLKDGKIYDEATLDKQSNWTHAWYDLDATARWNIVEFPIDKYTVIVTREGTMFFVKNSFHDPKPPEPNLPQTGQLWWPIPVFAAVGIAFIVVGIVFTKKKSCEK